ncbi:MAG: glycerol kinase GlpK [Rhizobiaceae bacterium]
MAADHVLAIDQGTTSSRAIVFTRDMAVAGVAQREFAQHYPASGWVEHDPGEIWRTVVETVKGAIAAAGLTPERIASIGVTNQRETVVVWDRRTGEPIHNAIVWQDRRTAATCARLKRDGLERTVAGRTGLLLDPYFSATKIAWVLDHVKGARGRAGRGELLAGTIDSFLLWRLTGGKVHATDATNAARTLLHDIRKGGWDEDLLSIFRVPRQLLPAIRDCDAEFGVTDKALFGVSIPILGMAGDQQAATMGQACFSPGMLKSTYGTGCFAVLNTGETFVPSRSRLLTTIAYRLQGRTTYALEGSIFIAGAAVQWLRDGLGIIDRADRSGELAAQADEGQHVYLVPAFVGLGAPHWDSQARGALYGLTRNTGPAEIARAALESVAFQTNDLLQAMKRDWKGGSDTVLRVDGGMVASDWTMQRLADILDAPVDRPRILETTAFGAGWLAGSGAGLWPGRERFSESWRLDRRFEPAMDSRTRRTKLKGWRDAVRRTLSP